MAKNILEVVLQGVDKLTKPTLQAGESLKDFEKRTKASSKSMKALGKTALGVTASVAAFGVAAAKAFTLGREGAAIKQTGQSFEFLMKNIGASADTLQQLRAASGGTVSDMKLMSSTATLLAGAQGELGTQLAQATPQLLEIARAAQKLNPSLGDTTFLYNSLAVGIKRGSPLILDNLGLLVSQGDANKRLAAQMGKTVAALTAEEQKMALLNETMRAGSVLIDQAGGTTESATDAYNAFTTSISNTTDAYKVLIHENIKPAVGLMATMAQKVQENVSLQLQLKEAVSEGNISKQEANRLMFLMSKGAISTGTAMKRLQASLWRADINETIEGAAVAFTELEAKLWRTEAASRETDQTFKDMAFSMDMIAVKASDIGEEIEKGASAGASAFEFMAGVVGDFNEKEAKEFDAALGGISQQLKDEMAIALGDTTQEIVDMERKLRELEAGMGDVATAAEAARWIELAGEIDVATKAHEEFAIAARDSLAAMEGQDKVWAQNVQSFNKVEEATGFAKIQQDRFTDGVVRLQSEARKMMQENHDSVRGMHSLRDTTSALSGETTKLIKVQGSQVRGARSLNDTVRTLTGSTSTHTGTVENNTRALKDNSEELARSDELMDDYAIATGRASVESVALQDRIDAATEAFREHGEASGFAKEDITRMRLEYDAITDSLSSVRSEINQTSGAIKVQGNAALGTTMSLLQMRAALVGAGGSYWGTASEQQVRDEFQSLADIQESIDAQKAADIERFPFGSFEGHAYTVDKGVAGMSAEDWMKEFDYRLLQDYPRMDLPGMGGGLDEDVRAQLQDMFDRREIPFVSGEAFTPGEKGTANVSSGHSVQMGIGQYEAEYGWRRDHPGMEMPDRAAHGANFMVPPHYPNDTYMMGVSSGERVSVTPAHMLGSGNGSGGGMAVNTINVYGVQTSSQLYDEVVKAARQRGKEFVKTM